MTTPNLTTGMHMVGIIRGISSRTVTVRSTGTEIQMHDIVVEADDFQIYKFVLSKAQVESQIHKAVSEKFTGKRCLIPIQIFQKNGYLNSQYRSLDLPTILA